MNVYVGIRTIFHSLLFLVNLLSLIVAAATAALGDGHKATAGSVLVIISTIFYAFIAIGTWSEACIPRSRLSRNRMEAITLPVLFLLEIIAAIVNTAETSKGTCMDQSLCLALLILSWMSAATLLVYYLITMIVLFYHFQLHEDLWNESPLSYNWFPAPSTRPVVPPKDLIVNPPREIAGAQSIEIASVEPPPPTFLGHRRHRSSWMPPPLDPETKMRDLRGAAEGSGSGDRGRNAGGEQSTAEVFEDIPLDDTPAVEEQANRFSFTVPLWARKLSNAKRGVEAPFPPTVGRPRHPLRIDAPVSPTSFQGSESLSS